MSVKNEIHFAEALLLVSMWRHGSQADGQEQKHFSPLGILLSCKFFEKKVYCFLPPTWSPCHVIAKEVEKQSHLEHISPCSRRDYSVSNIVLWRGKSVSFVNVFSNQDKHYSCGKKEQRAVSSFLPLNPLKSINILIDQGHSTTLSSLIHWKRFLGYPDYY